MKRHAEIGTPLHAPIGMRSQFEERLREHNRHALDDDKPRRRSKPVKMTEVAWYVGRILA